MEGPVSASGQISSASAPGGVDAPYGAPDDPVWRWATLSPALLMMLLLSVLPLANLFLTSFYSVSWSGGRAVWLPVGLANYAALARDDLLQAGVVNTLIFAVFAVGGQMLLGFVLALLCVRVTSGRTLYRTIFILPILIPGIVVGAMWKLLLNFDFGLVNQLVGLAGFDPVNWLGAKETALASVILVDIWHWTPFCFLLFLAGLESLPQDIYEATRIDGATIWQELVHVTLPMMWPTIVVTFAFRLILAFKVFDEVYLLTSGGPGTATEVLSFTLYQRFFREDKTGYGAALLTGAFWFSPVLKNFSDVLFSKTSDFLVNYRNSLVVGIASTLLCLVAATLAAWSLHRMRWPKWVVHGFLGWALVFHMFPPLALAGAWYTMMRTVGLDNSLFGVVLAHAVLNLPMAVWLMGVFIRDVPIELEEAARIDGASTPTVLWLVVVPIITPGLAATGILTFVFSWNEFAVALTLTMKQTATVPVAIAKFAQEYEILYTQMAAAAALSILPALVLLIIGQRYIVAGLTQGAVK